MHCPLQLSLSSTLHLPFLYLNHLSHSLYQYPPSPPSRPLPPDYILPFSIRLRNSLNDRSRVKAGTNSYSSPRHLRRESPHCPLSALPLSSCHPTKPFMKLKLTKLSKQQHLSRAVVALLSDRNLTHNALGRLELSFDRLSHLRPC